MRKKILITLLLLAALSLLAACGGEEGGEEEAPSEVGDASAGEALYHSQTIGDTGAPGCITCHSVDPTDDPFQPSPVGPSHYGVADRAGTYVEGMSAEEYLRQSIVDPNAHVVEGFQPNVMYQNYAEDLTDTQINNLVAYLLTLHEE